MTIEGVAIRYVTIEGVALDHVILEGVAIRSCDNRGCGH